MSHQKKEKCIIHIGMPKTGSTSLQMAWQADRQRLEENGILYPDFQRNDNNYHWPLMLPFLPKPQLHPLILKDNYSPKELRKFIKQSLQHFQTQLLESKANTCLLSSEGFFDIEGHHLKLFHKFMLNLFKQVTIVVYFRKASSLYPSYIQELLKSGVLIANLPLPQDYRSVALERIQEFQKVFGEENVAVCSFERDQLKDRNVVTDFYTRFLPVAAKDWKRRNKSLPGNIAICLSILTEKIPRMLSTGEDPSWRFLRQVLMKADWDEIGDFSALTFPKEWIYFVAKNHDEDTSNYPAPPEPVSREEFSAWFYQQVDTTAWQNIIEQIIIEHFRAIVFIHKENNIQIT